MGSHILHPKERSNRNKLVNYELNDLKGSTESLEATTIKLIDKENEQNKTICELERRPNLKRGSKAHRRRGDGSLRSCQGGVCCVSPDLHESVVLFDFQMGQSASRYPS